MAGDCAFERSQTGLTRLAIHCVAECVQVDLASLAIHCVAECVQIGLAGLESDGTGIACNVTSIGCDVTSIGCDVTHRCRQVDPIAILAQVLSGGGGTTTKYIPLRHEPSGTSTSVDRCCVNPLPFLRVCSIGTE